MLSTKRGGGDHNSIKHSVNYLGIFRLRRPLQTLQKQETEEENKNLNYF